MAFKYDIVSLIELVETKPCLWDKTHDEYKNKQLRDNSWREICEFLEERYDDLNQEEKKKTGQNIMQKWTNIRDAFLRSLKTKSGESAKKKYVYHEHLQFLLKFAEKADTNSNITNSTNARELLEESQSSVVEEPSNQEHLGKTPRKRQRKLDTIEAEILKELRTDKPERQMQESNHFFTSFIPYISDMTEPEKLQLRIDILASISKIKQNRNIQSPTHFSLSSTSTTSAYPNCSSRQSMQSVQTIETPAPSPDIFPLGHPDRGSTSTEQNAFQVLFNDYSHLDN